MKKFLLLTAIASVASVAVVAPVMAQTASGSFVVESKTTELCLAPTATKVTVGEYNGIDPVNLAAATTVKFKCTNTTPATVSLTPAGATTGNTATNTGTLKSAAGTTPITYSISWTGTGHTGSGVSATGTSIDVPVGLTITADQNPTPGDYEDTIGIAVSY